MDFKKILAEIEAKKNEIAVKRDELRNIMDDLEECLASFNAGIDGLEDGKREIEDVIDVLSQQI